jgi:hypothetical protein
VLGYGLTQKRQAVTLIELAITTGLMIADAWVWVVALSAWVP